MNLKRVSRRIDPASLGIEVDDDYEKITDAIQEDGSVDLAVAYDPPKTPANPLQKTVAKAIDKAGLADEKAYQKEYQLKVTHQVMINGGSTAKLAEMLGISLAQAKALKQELNARLVHEVKTLDKNKMIGQALMLYDNVQAKFLQMGQIDPKNPDKNLRSKIEALKGALQAQSDKQKLLKEVGLYRDPVTQGEGLDAHSTGANDLRELAQMVMSGEEFEITGEDDAEEDHIELL